MRCEYHGRWGLQCQMAATEGWTTCERHNLEGRPREQHPSHCLCDECCAGLTDAERDFRIAQSERHAAASGHGPWRRQLFP